MKHIAYIFSVLLLFFLTFDFMILQLQRAQIRRQVKEMTEEQCRREFTVCFTYPVDNPGIFSEDEFCLKGNMYDVKKRECLGDSVRITCINDTREKALMLSYFSRMRDEKSNDGKQRFRWNLNKIFYEIPHQEFVLSFAESETLNPVDEDPFPDPFLHVMEGPPKRRIA